MNTDQLIAKLDELIAATRSAAAILKQHNVWRRWNGDWDEDGPEPVGPAELGRAIDMVVAHIEGLTPTDPQSPPPQGCSTSEGS